MRQQRHLYLLVAAVVVFFFGGTGCTFAKKNLPLPPVYNQACEPSDPVYLDWAMDTTDLAEPGEIPSDPQEALDKALRIVEEKGIGIVEKEVTGQDKLDRFTTTMPRYIYVKPGFWDQEIWIQAATMWHEIVHIRQWQRLGRAVMGARWTVYAEGRWSLETVAYRESFRVYKLFGRSDAWIRDFAPKRAERFYETYALSGMPKECMVQITSEIWTMDLLEASTSKTAYAGWADATDP